MPRKPDPLWDVLEELFGAVRTTAERGRRNAALKQLREANATPDEIRITYNYCASKMSFFTEMAVCNWLSRSLMEHQATGSQRETFIRLLRKEGR